MLTHIIKERFDHEASKQALKEKYQAKMIFAHQGGMFRAGPELIAVLSTVQQDRVVYLVKIDNKVVDGTGRSLNGRKPKWRRYGNNKHPFICGRDGNLWIVEDTASACSVCDIVTALALMGTTLLDEYIDTIKNYKKVLIPKKINSRP